MADPDQSHASAKAERQAALELVGAYHQEQLRRLLSHVREGFTQLETGEFNEFELDQLIHRYKKAASRLWAYCSVTQAAALATARAIERMRDTGEELDWWPEAKPQRKPRD